MDLPWPDHPAFPPYGYVITRHDLDRSSPSGRPRPGPPSGRGPRRSSPSAKPSGDDGGGGRPTAGDVAEGSLPRAWGRWSGTSTGAGRSRSGPATWWWPTGPTPASAGPSGRSGTGPTRWGWPCGATTGHPRHDDTFIESHLDIRDGVGKVVPGYGWIFPLGDGRVNVGVGLLSVEGRWKGVNTSHLMDTFVAAAPDYWELSPAASCGAPTGGKLPWDCRSGPRLGPTTLVVGDASGAINPFNGEGDRLRLRDGPAGRLLPGPGPVGRGLRGPGRLRGPAGGGLRALLPGGPGLRPDDQQPRRHAGLRPDGDALRRASWAGCCGSWPTCCGPRKWARPRPPTGPWPPWPGPSSPPELAALLAEALGGARLLGGGRRHPSLDGGDEG